MGTVVVALEEEIALEGLDGITLDCKILKYSEIAKF
jgi:hypothetical protein